MRTWLNTPHTYGVISLFLHWLMALLVITMMVLGWGRDFAPAPWRSGMMDAHKTIGIIILLLFFLRLSWRFYSKPPKLPKEFSISLKRVAYVTHGALYFMLFAMPLSGWIMMSAMGRTIYFLGLVTLPPLMHKTPSIVPFLKDLHGLMAYGFASLIVLHALAALFHHFVKRDDILRRMMPSLNKREICP